MLQPCLSLQLILVDIILQGSLLCLACLNLTVNAPVGVYVSLGGPASLALLPLSLLSLLGSWLPHKIESVGTPSHLHNFANVSTSHELPPPFVR